MINFHRYLFLLGFTLFLSFTGNAQSFLNKVDNYTEFDKLSGKPLSDKYGMVKAVKIVLDLKDSNVYYCSSKDYRYHHDFCRKKLKYYKDVKTFNDLNYSNSKSRRFLLANLNFFENLELFILEISAIDKMSSNQIEFLYETVISSFYARDSLRFLLNSSSLQEDQLNLRSIKPSEVYNNQNFQAISNAKNKGILRFIDDLEDQSFSEKDILVLKHTPLFLPKVAGIIVAELQTPLSHLSILGKNRDIPIAAIKNVFEDSYLLSLKNNWVSYEVTNAGFNITKSDSSLKFKLKRASVKIHSNLKVDSIVEIKKLKRRSYRFVGNKAHNFSILSKLSKKQNFKVPESAFAIPFYFYNQHIQESNTNKLIDELLKIEQLGIQEDSIRNQLKRIRKSILAFKLDSTLLFNVENKIRSLGDFTRMRFRSSTNAEDAKGFSGAGLYRSKTGDLNDAKKPINLAIKKVWASLWSYDAFMERSYFGIDHKEVYMGILVHRSFPNEAVNGVCISKNLYRKDYPGFIVNAQLGNESVVEPKEGQSSDQFICFPDSTQGIYSQQSGVEIITSSNLNNKQLTMSKEEIRNLANQIEYIKRYMFLRTPGSNDFINFGLDFEFKLDGPNRDLYIKQMRLFND